MKRFIWTLLMVLIGCTSPKSTEQQAQTAMEKTVMISVDTGKQAIRLVMDENGLHIVTFPLIYIGAGVIVSDRGDILTAAHLFETTGTITVEGYSGQNYRGVLKAVDVQRDLAWVSLEPLFHGNSPYRTQFAEIADPRELKVGQHVLMCGNPEGLDWTVTHGIISALHRDNRAEGCYNYLQTDAPANPGNSGGPIFNEAGEVVGILVRAWQGADGLGFAVEAGQIREFLTRHKVWKREAELCR